MSSLPHWTKLVTINDDFKESRRDWAGFHFWWMDENNVNLNKLKRSYKYWLQLFYRKLLDIAIKTKTVAILIETTFMANIKFAVFLLGHLKNVQSKPRNSAKPHAIFLIKIFVACFKENKNMKSYNLSYFYECWFWK